MKEGRWAWLVFTVWVFFVVVALISIGIFIDNKDIQQMSEYGVVKESFNYSALFSCVFTIVGAFITAATVSMIESIYRAVVKQINQ